MLNIKIELRVSEPEMILFFREKGITVKEIEYEMLEASYHNRTEKVEYKQWVVINPNTQEQIPMEEQYRDIVRYQTQNLLINSIDRFTVYNSFTKVV
ncbi:MAG: hypothetical protein COC06_07680 [Bacteroidales bacterium]|nr:MAG: hypothetical protein COC06_07680 [Bacteroidales bacterium]